MRQVYALTMQPVHQIAVEHDTMHSTGSDPYLLLQPEGGVLPVGDCEFAFEALPGTVPLLPVLYLDTGAGFNEAGSVRLLGGEAGHYRSIVELPAGLIRLRFDPTTLEGPIPIANPRLVLRQSAPPSLGTTYAAWLQRYHTLSADDEDEIRRHIQTWRAPPKIEVRVAAGTGAGQTAQSLWGQLYPHWRAELPPGEPARFGTKGPRWRVKAGEASHILPLRAGDVLPPHALYALAAAVLEHPDAAVFTLDHDERDPATGERSHPSLHGAWSPDLAQGGGGPRVMLVQAAMLGRPLADLPAAAIQHVAGVIVSRSAAAEPDRARPYPALTTTPLVSIIVATRDAVTMLRRTAQGVLERTSYGPLEVIVLDNGSADPATHDYFAALQRDPRVRVLPAPGPFNYAGLNNTGVAAASGDIIVLLNNDMDVMEPGWLTELVSHALRPEVGAVGCKLLYPDGTVQHAGIVTALMGLAGHGFRGLDGGAPGYLGLAARVRNVAAVTGACLAMRRQLYQQAGGLDDAQLGVSYNDVDLCLRLRQQGYLIVWTPFATLCHLESATRGVDSAAHNAERAQREHDALLRRWGKRLLHDPYYSPCLALDAEDYRLAWPPRLALKWRDWADHAETRRRWWQFPRRAG